MTRIFKETGTATDVAHWINYNTIEVTLDFVVQASGKGFFIAYLFDDQYLLAGGAITLAHLGHVECWYVGSQAVLGSEEAAERIKLEPFHG